jgi:hypothetical protein
MGERNPLYVKITASCTEEEKDRWLVAVGQQSASMVLRKLVRDYCIEQETKKAELKNLKLNGSTEATCHHN